MLYVEMLAEGTVPQDVKVTRRRPMMLPWKDNVEGHYARAELDDLTLYAFAIEPPLDEEGNPCGDRDPLYVEVSWVDDDGYSVRVHTDPLKGAASLASGWGSMPWVMEYQGDPALDAGVNLCAWGGYGLTIEETPEGKYDITQDSGDQGATAFVHLYERRIS